MISSTGSHRLDVKEFWFTDSTEHATREGKVFCSAVLGACGRKIVGDAIDSRQDSTLAVNPNDMAISARTPEPGEIIHADHVADLLRGFSPRGFVQSVSCLRWEPLATGPVMTFWSLSGRLYRSGC